MRTIVYSIVCSITLPGIITIIFASTAAFADEGPDMLPGMQRIVAPDGGTYIGFVRDGKRHGAGRFIWPDGAEYQGGFRDGEPHGDGIYWFPDGRRKEVSYKMGKLIAARMISNAVRLGDCIFGEYESNGRYKGWYRGDRMKGYIPHGRGTMRYLNGSVYSGQWEDGRMHGNGSIRWEDGSRYAGQWVRGKRTGSGTYIWPSGDRYVGEWKDNQMCGTGTYYYSDGRIRRGVWKETTIQVNE
ncbi:MAG: hypothetical protein JW807_11555 [Spirochaetes bacterium]|nr:hypothetical protein [Spirochaetota bacterium]